MKARLLVRGDLRSHFGAARHLRANLPMLEPHFKSVQGVDLHYHQRFNKNTFPHDIVTDKSAERQILKYADDLWTVYHHVTPEHFHRFQNAFNLGYFVWETDRPPQDSSWQRAFSKLDAIWVAAPCLEKLVHKLGWDKPILTVPWPMDPPKKDTILKLPDLDLCEITPQKKISATFDQLVNGFDGHYLSIGTDAPRKALPILLSEWVRYKRVSKQKFALVLKLSTFNCGKTNKQLLAECQQVARIACAPLPPRSLDLFVLIQSLSDIEIAGLYASARGLVSTTIGEGFGGPVAEAALQEKPILAPRHSSLGPLIPENYPLALDHERTTLGQGPNSPYAISSSWGLIRSGTLMEKLLELDNATGKTLENYGRKIGNHVRKTCSPNAIGSLVSDFFSQIQHPVAQAKC